MAYLRPMIVLNMVSAQHRKQLASKAQQQHGDHSFMAFEERTAVLSNNTVNIVSLVALTFEERTAVLPPSLVVQLASKQHLKFQASHATLVKLLLGQAGASFSHAAVLESLRSPRETC